MSSRRAASRSAPLYPVLGLVLSLGIGLGLSACGASAGSTASSTSDPTQSSSATATSDAQPGAEPATGSDEPGGAAPTLVPPIAPGSSGTYVLDDRSFEVAVPSGYDPATPAPLVMVLHGYSSDGAEVDAYTGLRARADERGALYVVPEGIAEPTGRKFWNATDACCDFGGTEVDDSGYLATVLRAVAATFAVDPSRVVVVGHSNGGFMAYRMACDHADLVTHAVSIAGAMALDEAACAPSRPVSVLQVHGTADPTIRYEGGSNGPFRYPSAVTSVEAWARFDGCSAKPEQATEALDVDAARPGAETSVTAFRRCDDGARVELWSVDGAGHVPTLTESVPDALLDYVLGGS